jgi:hypothetical protein
VIRPSLLADLFGRFKEVGGYTHFVSLGRQLLVRAGSSYSQMSSRRLATQSGSEIHVLYGALYQMSDVEVTINLLRLID